MADISVPVEGTLLYVEDVQYDGVNEKVSKIDEKGYYFYNGRRWVKFSDPHGERALWWHLGMGVPAWEQLGREPIFYFSHGLIKGKGNKISLYGDFYNVETGSPILCESYQGAGLPLLKVRANYAEVVAPAQDIMKYLQGEKEFLVKKEEVESLHANYEVYSDRTKVMTGCANRSDLMVRLGNLIAVKYRE
ncbi:hypothetical protein ACQ1PR_07380 [Ornithobacterium rhinotracheale]